MMQEKGVKGSSSDPSWIELVRKGQFNALPAPLQWVDSTSLAYLIDGYQERGSDELGPFANRQLESAEKSGFWQGSIKDLWCCLFYEHRRARWTSPLLFAVIQNPDGSVPELQETIPPQEIFEAELRQKQEGSPLLNALCETIRLKLIAVEPNGRAEITAWIAQHAALRSKKGDRS